MELIVNGIMQNCTLDFSATEIAAQFYEICAFLAESRLF